jgi:phosphoesterase RecJ-like protein
MDDGPGRGWQSLHEVLSSHTSFLLTSHIFPEGDSIGSEVALGLHLQSMGKEVRILNPTPARECYSFLAEMIPVGVLTGADAAPLDGEAYSDVDVAIALDVGSWDYLGPLGELLIDRRLPLVVIDHHHPNPDFGDLAIVDTMATSTGEMVYEYLRWSGSRVTPDMAQALYTSIVSDTGGFRLPRSENRTVIMAADLLRMGADHATTSRAVFQSESYERFDLLRVALANMHVEEEGKLAWISLPQEAFAQTRTTLQDGDGILDHLLAIADLQTCVLFREVAGFGTRVTFRSKGVHDVGRIAHRLGGGGRPTAAGVFLPVSLTEAMDVVLTGLRELHARPARRVTVSASAS